MGDIFLAAAKAGWTTIYTPEELDTAVAPLERWQADIHDRQRGHLRVYDQSPTVLGFTRVTPSPDADATTRTWHLAMLYVHPSAWGKGIGRALLNDAVEIARSESADEITLWTSQRNPRAQRLYSNAGWDHDQTTKIATWLDRDDLQLRYRLPLD